MEFRSAFKHQRLFERFLMDVSQDPTFRGVHQTLPGHNATVTTIKFFPPSKNHTPPDFISGDASGGAILWHESILGSVCYLQILSFLIRLTKVSCLKWVQAKKLALDNPIGALSMLNLHENSYLCAFGLINSSISLFQLDLRSESQVSWNFARLKKSEVKAQVIRNCFNKFN